MQVINFKLLEKKILNKLNSPIAQSDDIIVNLYDLNKVVTNTLLKYNKDIYKEANALKDKMNILLNNDTKNTIRIQSINPRVKYNIPYIIVKINEYINGYVRHNELLYIENSLEVKNAKKLFKILNSFIIDNPGINFSWDKDNEKDNVITSSDGFLSYKLDLRNIEYPIIGFSNYDDAVTASLKIPHEGGELNDYIDFYKDDFLKRQSILIDKLPKNFKEIYTKNYMHKKTLKK